MARIVRTVRAGLAAKLTASAGEDEKKCIDLVQRSEAASIAFEDFLAKQQAYDSAAMRLFDALRGFYAEANDRDALSSVLHEFSREDSANPFAQANSASRAEQLNMVLRAPVQGIATMSQTIISGESMVVA